jgi:hypothetical protein
MSVGSINSTNLLGSILNAAQSNGTKEAGPGIQSDGSGNTSISSIGALMNAVSQMSDDDKSSIKSFLDSIKSSVQDGSFDIDAAVEEAPDALKSYAETNGIDLTDLVNDLADGAKGSGVYGPPPPENSDNASATSGNLDLSSLSNLTDDEKSDLQSFMESIKSSIENGTFDADTLASSAPEAIQNLAEENNMSVSDLIQELGNEAKNILSSPPPANEMSGSNGYQNSALSGSTTSSYSILA